MDSIDALLEIIRTQYKAHDAIIRTQYQDLVARHQLNKRRQRKFNATISLLLCLVFIIPYFEQGFTITELLITYIITCAMTFLFLECVPSIFEQTEGYNKQRLELLNGMGRIDAFYVGVAKTLSSFLDGSALLVEMDNTLQRFSVKSELKANFQSGAIGTIMITPQSHIQFMTSVYGDGRPSAEEQILKTLQIRTESDFVRWNMLSNIDVIEIPCVKVSLFPGIVKDKSQWSFLIQGKGPPEDIRIAFENICRLIICDIISRKLQAASPGWRSAARVDPVIKEEDLAPYFEEKDKAERPLDVQKAFENITALFKCMDWDFTDTSINTTEIAALAGSDAENFGSIRIGELEQEI